MFPSMFNYPLQKRPIVFLNKKLQIKFSFEFILDDLEVSNVHSYLSSNDVDGTSSALDTIKDAELVQRVSGDPGLGRKKPMESLDSDQTGFVEDTLEMTSNGQQTHLQRHSKWTNSRKYLPAVSFSSSPQQHHQSFQPISHNDIAVVTVEKHSASKSQLPFLQQQQQQQKQQQQQQQELLSKKNFVLPSAEAWSDNKSDQTENRPVVHPTTTKPVTTPASAKQQQKSSSNVNVNVKNKNKTSAPNALRTTTTAQPHQPVHIGFPSSSHTSSIYRHRHLPSVPTPFLTEEMIRQKELDEFYKNYDPREGIVTAIVLGGFFIFVSLLVLYKTKCKPMWKNRRKRLTNTPVTQSVVEGDSVAGRCNFDFPSGGFDDLPVVVNSGCDDEQCDEPDVTCDDDFGFECIPLQTVCNDDEDNDDIYFLDEFGNYVFPVSTPTIPGSCSCPPSAEDLAATSRRVSQVTEWFFIDFIFNKTISLV